MMGHMIQYIVAKVVCMEIRRARVWKEMMHWMAPHVLLRKFTALPMELYTLRLRYIHVYVCIHVSNPYIINYITVLT